MALNQIKIFFLSLIISSCVSKEREIWYLIPEHYDGPVSIKYGYKNSKNKIIKFKDDLYMIVINGNPMDFEISDKNIPSGYYVQKHFYYSNVAFYQIETNGMGWNLPRYPIVADAGNYGKAPLKGFKGGEYFYVYRNKKSREKRDSLLNLVNTKYLK